MEVNGTCIIIVNGVDRKTDNVWGPHFVEARLGTPESWLGSIELNFLVGNSYDCETLDFYHVLFYPVVRREIRSQVFMLYHMLRLELHGATNPVSQPSHSDILIPLVN